MADWLDEIKARRAAVTPGWERSGNYIVVVCTAPDDPEEGPQRWEEGIFQIDFNATEGDVAAVVHYAADMDRLIAEVERLRGGSGG